MTAPAILAVAIFSLRSPFTPASTRDQPRSVAVACGTLDGHACQTGGVSKVQVVDMDRYIKPHNLRPTFSEGKHIAYVTGLEAKFTNAAGQKAVSFHDACQRTDVNLPPGYCRAVADFYGVKRNAGANVKKG